MIRESSHGNTKISIVLTDIGTITFSVSGTRPAVVRNNIYDALSDYGVGYDTAKEIVRLFLKTKLPDIRVNLLNLDWKGNESKKANRTDE